MNAEVGSVAVVTDSTSYLPAGVADRLGITVVPLRVQLGDRTGIDGVDVGADDVGDALRRHLKVTTSRPTPTEFADTYRGLLAEGADRIVSVHLSTRLSGTWDSARLAAGEFPDGVVRVVDSRTAAMGLGFAVMTAAEVARGGASAADVERATSDVVDTTTSLLYVDSLEYLRRGGRVGAAAALLGTGLSIKPLLQVRDGEIVPLEKVRTSAKALTRLVQIATREIGDSAVDVAVQHLAAPDAAAAMVERLRAALPGVRTVHQSELGAVVGAHLGPGTLGVMMVKRPGSVAGPLPASS